MQKIILNDNNKSCPFCKQIMNEKNTYDTKRIEQKIKYINIICPNDECIKEVKFNNLINHLQEECLHEMAYCKKCNSIMIRKDLEQHNNNFCPKRLVECEHCKNNFKFSEIEIHKEYCPKRKINCKNNCGEILPYEELEVHYNFCPEQEVNCPIKILLDCNYKCKSKDMHRHINNVQEHYLLALEKIKNMNNEAIEYNQKIINIQDQNNKIKYELKEVQEKLKLKETTLKEIKNDIRKYGDSSFLLSKKIKDIMNNYKSLNH